MREHCCSDRDRQTLFHGRAVGSVNLQYGAQLFRKQCCQRIAAQRGDIRLNTAVAGEGHLSQRDQQTAIRAVVVSQQFLLADQRLNCMKKPASCAASRTSAGLSPSWRYTCDSAVAPRVLAPLPRSTSSSRLSPSGCSCGVTVRRTSSTRAKAVMTSDSGEVISRCSVPCCQRVFIDMESLPTGMVIPSAGHSSSPTAFTAAYRPASSPG